MQHSAARLLPPGLLGTETCVDGCPDQEFLSFNDTNNNQDNFPASGSVSADRSRVTLSESVQQITDVSPTSFSADLQTLITVDAFGRG